MMLKKKGKISEKRIPVDDAENDRKGKISEKPLPIK
jgi:hypothetical protein